MTDIKKYSASLRFSHAYKQPHLVSHPLTQALSERKEA